MLLGTTTKISNVSQLFATCVMVAGLSLNVQASELRDKLSVDAQMITLEDIFTDTGEAGSTIIMEAPAPGSRKQINSFELNKIAERYDLEWERPPYLKRIYIEREGTHFAEVDLEPMIMDQIRDLGVDADLNLNLYGLKKGFYLPAGYGLETVEFESFSLSNRQDRFTAVLKTPVNENEMVSHKISGTLQEVRLVPVLNRLVTPGEIIESSDIVWKRHPARRINATAITDAKMLVGQTVKRALPAKKLLRKTDVEMPVMIEKGSSVTMTLRSGAMTLSLRGRALDDGGEGDVIRVMNTKSNRSLQALVIAPGKVEVQARPTIRVAAR